MKRAAITLALGVMLSLAQAQINIHMGTQSMRIRSGTTMRSAGTITMEQPANRIWLEGTLRLMNDAPNALTATQGGIVHEQTNMAGGVIWNMKQATPYTIPFVNGSAQSTPVMVQPAQASAGDRMVTVGTYATASNNTPYPPTVMHVDHDGVNASADMPDRYWRVTSAATMNAMLAFTHGAAEDAANGTDGMQAQWWNNGSQEWQGAGGQQTATRTVAVPHGLNAGQDLTWSLRRSPGVRLALKAFLGGPFNTSTQLMNDGLRSGGHIPLVEPYSGLGFTMLGGSGASIAPGVLATTGSNAIVDWVLVELRDAVNPAQVVATKPALIQRDGDVVDLDGVSALSIAAPADNYRVALRHRNHLGVMTAHAPALADAPVVIDLRQGATVLHGTGAQQVLVNAHVLWPGNVVHDAQVKFAGTNNDRDPILLRIGGTVPTNTVPGYWPEDINLDGVVKYVGTGNDRDVILLAIGGTVPTNSIIQQLP